MARSYFVLVQADTGAYLQHVWNPANGGDTFHFSADLAYAPTFETEAEARRWASHPAIEASGPFRVVEVQP